MAIRLTLWCGTCGPRFPAWPWCSRVSSPLLKPGPHSVSVASLLAGEGHGCVRHLASQLPLQKGIETLHKISAWPTPCLFKPKVKLHCTAAWCSYANRRVSWGWLCTPLQSLGLGKRDTLCITVWHRRRLSSIQKPTVGDGINKREPICKGSSSRCYYRGSSA